MMLEAALACIFVFWVANVVQKALLINISYSPICLCALLGVVAGKPTEGLIMGGYLQAIFLGVIAIGGVAPANKQLGSIIPCAFVLYGGMELEAALAIAYTIGVLSNSVGRLTTPLFAACEPAWKRLALKCDAKAYGIAHWVWFLVISMIPSMVIIFVSVAFGTETISNLMAMLPPKFMNGLSVASGCLTAVGIAIALKLTWQTKYCGFFFLGWVLTYCLKLTQIQTAIVAVAVAAIWYFVSAEMDKKIAANAGSSEQVQGGDFF